MTNIIRFPTLPQTTLTDPTPSQEAYCDLEQVAKGIGIALLVTKDHEAVQFLLSKFNRAVNSRQFEVYLTPAETRKYIDYLGPSAQNDHLASELLKAYLSTE